MFCYFLDRGPSAIDFFFTEKMTENPNLTAVRLMTKSTALVKGDSTQQVEQSIIGQLSGPDIFPVHAKYRMVWYNWLISNRFSNDSRIRKSGAIAGIYCIYSKEREPIIRNSLEVIETVLGNASAEFKTVDDIIRKKMKLSTTTFVNQAHYSDFLMKEPSDDISREMRLILNKVVQEFSQRRSIEPISQIKKFKLILQYMVFKKGRPDEIVKQSEKRQRWVSMIRRLDKTIKDRMPDLILKKTSEKELKEIYRSLAIEKIWAELPLGELHPLIQVRDVADFFFYYWLVNHQLLKKKRILKAYTNLIGSQSI